MFENIDCSVILDVIRKNDCDMEQCIDQLLSLPEPETLPPKEPEELYPSRIFSTAQLPVTPSLPVKFAKEELSPIQVRNNMDVLSEKAERMLAKKKKIEEKIQRRAQKLQQKKQKQQAKDKRRAEFIARERRPARTISDPSLPFPTLSNEPVPLSEEPTYVQPPNLSQDREFQLLKIITDLQAETLRLEEEKRNGMKWVINEMRSQVADRDTQIAEKDAQLKENERKIEELKDQIHKLQDAFRESKSKENRLGKLLLNSKDVIVEGVITLSKNVTQATEKGWAKVQKEFLNEEKEMHVLEKMKEFAQTLKEEINRAFYHEPQPLPQANVDEVDEGDSESDSESSDEEDN